MKFSTFLDEHRHLDEEQFATRYDHAFLLVTKARPGDSVAPVGFHTKEAFNAKEILLGTYADAEIHDVVKQGGGGLSTMVAVGRTAANDIVLDGDAISKFHAYFKLTGSGEYTLCDPGSTNGTTVNGIPLERNTPVTMRGGETVGFGNAVEATFHTPRTLHRHMKIVGRWLDSR